MDLDARLALWRLTSPKLVAETATSTVWRVAQPDGTPAALKLLRPGETEEARGADYLQALAGHGAVRVYGRNGDAILMEWCEGPALGDLARADQDDAATEIQCDVIQTLHGEDIPSGLLEPLTARFAPLTTPRLDGDLATAAHLARDLLTSTTTAVALHGDLHHDNIMHSARGWLAIDPKGVSGDPAYETANAFRNPEGTGDLPFRPDRITRLADRFSRRLGQPPRRILGWAAAHCALSTFWSREAGRDSGEDLRLLPLLLDAARR
jgi:streptomycin 6-kinase